MRGLILALLLANVAFFGWAHWIDVPPAVQAAAPASALPLLALAGSGSTGARANTTASASMAATAQPGQAGSVAAGAAAQAAKGGPPRCRSLGPFTTAAGARAAADVLRARNLAPRNRTVDITLAGGTVRAYWLDVDLAAGEADPPLAALRERPGGAAAALRGVAFSDCPATGAGG
ncbi:MAG: hypothetical protein ACRETK_07245 [Steroidobacteraceae bacterium]